MNKRQLLQQMQQLYQQQNWQAMLQLCETGLQHFPNSVSTLYNRAIARVNLGLFQEAKQDLEKALEIRPDQNVKQFLAKINQKLAKNTDVKSSTKPQPSPSMFFEKNKDNLIQLFEELPQPEKKQFGRYQIVEELGRGGMGKVYKAHDGQLGRFIALKVIISGNMASKKETDRFMREAKATAQLKHPNVISVYDIGIEDGNPYFTMDLVEGISLKEYLQKAKRDIHKIIKIMIKVGNAIHYANQQGIIHRDIKPANIMITKTEEPLVMDFGLAKVTSDEELSKTGDVLGTPAYMSPEQAQGKQVDKTTDVYALGATLYQILTGRPPFQGETYANIVMQIIEKDPIYPRVLNPEVPVELEAICLKCLEKKAEKRYNNAKSWSKDLNNFLEHKPIIAKKPTVITTAKKFIVRNKIFAFVLLVVFIGGVLSFTQWQRAEENARKANENAQFAQQQKKKAEDNAKTAHQQKQKAKIGERKKAIQLAKIALSKADEAYNHKEWGKFGTYAGTALEFLKEIPKGTDKIAFRLRNKAMKFIRLALYQSRLVWKSASPDMGNIRSLVFSADGKLLASSCFDNTIKLWDSASGKLLTTLVGHTASVNLVVFSPNDKLLASASSDNTIKLWDSATGKLLTTFLGHNSDVTSIAFNPDGKTLVSASMDKTAKLWNIATKKLVANHMGNIVYVALSSNGKLLASISNDNTIKLWDSVTAKLLTTLSGHNSNVAFVVFNPDGKTLISASMDKIMKLWDIATGKVIKTFTGGFPIAFSPDGKIFAFASNQTVQLRKNTGELLTIARHNSHALSITFSPGGKLLACAFLNSTVTLWDSSTGKLLTSLASHSLGATSVAFTPTGKKFASGSMVVKLWDSETGKLLNTLAEDTGWVRSMSFSSGGKLFASASDKTVRLWDNTGKLLTSFAGNTSVVFSPDGKLLASISNKIVRLWDSTTKKLLTSFVGHTSDVRSIAFSPDGKMLASTSHDKTVRLWDSGTGKLLATLTGHTKSVSSVAFSPNGKLLASASGDKTVRLWDIATAKEINKLFAHTHWIHSIAFSPDAKLLASASEDKTVKLWDTVTGEPLTSLSGHDSGVSSIAFSPDGKLLASASNDKTVRLWDGTIDVQLASIVGHGSQVNSIAFNPYNKVFASATYKTIILWDHITGKPLANLTGHNDFIHSVAFSPDGKLLASASSDKTVKLWDSVSGELLTTLTGHNVGVNSVVFSPDGKLLASGSITVKLWDSATKKLLATFKRSTSNANSLAFSPDSKVLASSSDKIVTLLDSATGKLLTAFFGHSSAVRAVIFSPNGKLLASASWDKTVKLWDSATGELFATLVGHNSPVDSLAFSPDSKILASGSHKEVRLWDSTTGKLLVILTGHTHNVTSLLFSPNGNFLASASMDGTVRLWNVNIKLFTPDKNAFKVNSIIFSRDNKTVAAFSQNSKALQLWDIASCKKLQTTSVSLLNTPLWQNQRSIKISTTTPYDFRIDIPGWLIAIALDKEPQQITQHLFEWRVKEDLSIEKYKPVYLWNW